MRWTFEWDIETGGFKCGSLYDSLNGLSGTASLAALTKAISSLPEEVTFVGHNFVQADLKILTGWGIRLPERFSVQDSLLLVRLAQPYLPAKGLKEVSRNYGLYYKDEHENTNPDELLQYCGRDTYCSYVLYSEILKTLDDRTLKLYSYYNALALAFLPIEVAGLKMDVKYLNDKAKECEVELSSYAGKLQENILTNDNVLRQYIQSQYSEWELRFLPKTESGLLGIDHTVLEQLPHQTEEFKVVLKARKLNDYYTLYVDRPRRMVDENGHIYPQYKILVPKTHRRSTEPAIQNWPKSSRRAIISRFTGGKILSADFANLEARLFAWQAGCFDFLQELLSGGYVSVARKVFGVTVEKGTPEYTLVKSTVLAVLYNMSDGLFKYRMKIEHGINMSKEEAREQKQKLFTAFPELQVEAERRKEFAKTNGYCENEFGVRIPIFYPPTDIGLREIQWATKSSENCAINYPTQSAASVVTGSALIEIHKQLLEDSGMDYQSYVQEMKSTTKGSKTSLKGFPIGEIHDELVFDVQGKYVKQVSELVKDMMKYNGTLCELCPDFPEDLMEAEVTIADSWSH